MDRKPSLFERLLVQPRPLWVTIVVSLLFLLSPFLAAYLDDNMSEFISEGLWRVSLLAPTIIVYIWIISPLMERTGEEVIISLRPLVPLEDDEFDQMVGEASHVNPRHQWVAFIVGASIGIASVFADGFGQDIGWLIIFWLLSLALMYGLLAWTIFIAIAGTRLNTVIHQQPLRIDIFDTTPFEPIGRQSLLLAFVFVVGITLSFIITFHLQDLSSSQFWIGYVGLVMVTVLIFFLNMRPTHKVLAEEKKRELESLQRHINHACRSLVKRLDQYQDSGPLPAVINALVAYEQRLQATRTWPYNTGMIRTLMFSVLIPLGSVLGRLLIELFSS